MSDKIGAQPLTTMTWTLAGGAYTGLWHLIAVTLAPVSGPVGGFVEPADTLALLSPWLAVIAVVGCLGTVVVIVKKRRP